MLLFFYITIQMPRRGQINQLLLGEYFRRRYALTKNNFGKPFGLATLFATLSLSNKYYHISPNRDLNLHLLNILLQSSDI